MWDSKISKSKAWEFSQIEKKFCKKKGTWSQYNFSKNTFPICTRRFLIKSFDNFWELYVKWFPGLISDSCTEERERQWWYMGYWMLKAHDWRHSKLPILRSTIGRWCVIWWWEEGFYSRNWENRMIGKSFHGQCTLCE